MTPQQINTRIAESMGLAGRWVILKRGLYYRPDGKGYTGNINEAWILAHSEAKKHEYLHDPNPVTIKEIPAADFLSDLNACAEFEEAMTDEQRVNYRVALVDICFRDWETGKHKHSSPTHATAPQRCEGRLTILGLWDEKEGE